MRSSHYHDNGAWSLVSVTADHLQVYIINTGNGEEMRLNYDKEKNGFGYPPETLWKQEVESDRGIVASEYPLATDVGKIIIESGGNAIDAAISMAFVLGVTEPYMSGVGGLGLGIVSINGKSTVINGQTVSPRSLEISEFAIAGSTGDGFFGWPLVRDNNNQMGPKSVTVPTEIAVLGEMHRIGANLEWRDLIAPSIKFAENGFECDWITSLSLLAERKKLDAYESASNIFFPGGVTPFPDLIYDRGIRIVQKDLAGTLRKIAEDGPESLYSGDLARKLSSRVKEDGGYLNMIDLEEYRVNVSEPESLLSGKYNVLTTSGFNGGPTIRDIVGSMEKHHKGDPPFTDIADESSEWIRLGTAALTRRKANMGHGENTRSEINPEDKRLGISGFSSGRMDESTTYLAVVHEEIGVSLNMTLLSRFGSGYVVPGLGVLMNNGCLWFDPARGNPNSIGAGVPHLENIAPVMLTSGGKLSGIVGSAGGRRIMPTNSQIIFNLTRLGYDARGAVLRPRVDFSAVPVLIDRRLDISTLQKIRRISGARVEYSELSLGRHSFASPIALWRMDGNWGCGIDPATVSSAKAT